MSLSSIMTVIRRYSELIQFDSFYDRFEYLKLGAGVGDVTFGFDRWINQEFYHSKQWRDVRRLVIIRDNGYDLGVYGHEIQGSPLIHHINPISVPDFVDGADWILDPDFLISTSHDTHNAIHYGDRSLLRVPFKERTPGDTKLW